MPIPENGSTENRLNPDEPALESSGLDVRAALNAIPLLASMPKELLAEIERRSGLVPYRIGRQIIGMNAMPEHLFFICSGKARVLYHDQESGDFRTLKLLNKGESFGLVSLLRNVSSEIVSASEETVCLQIPSALLQKILQSNEPLRESAFGHASPAEISILLDYYFDKEPRKKELIARAGFRTLGDLAEYLSPFSKVFDSGYSSEALLQEPSDLTWIVSRSSNDTVPPGTVFDSAHAASISGSDKRSLRLVGVDLSTIADQSSGPEPGAEHPELAEADASPVYDERDALSGKASRVSVKLAPGRKGRGVRQLPFVNATGIVDETLACFQMLGKYWNIPIKKDLIQRILQGRYESNRSVSLQDCGSVGVLLGLRAQIIAFGSEDVVRLKTPLLIRWGESFAIVYSLTPKEVTLAYPGDRGVKVLRLEEFLKELDGKGAALVLEVSDQTPEKKFGFEWFAPSVKKYRSVLIEVLVASFFMQVMTLGYPLLFQIIIDQVIVRNSITTLNVLGGFMLAIALVEALLSSLRTYLFVDTTNRIDIALGADVIDHLLRLPLFYFEKRPVGELGSRIGELERIRQFLTGTALTVFLDAVFSVIYVVALFLFSWKLTLISLAVIPIIGLITFFFSPIVRSQLREKAIKYGNAQAYLIEVLSGIQTVKSQNIELRARWNWQEKYADYVQAGFKPVITSTVANSTNNFLNKVTGVLVIWGGAYFVLKGEMSLGQLIAFRIISGYITSPVMRLVQLWQEFQEAGMSLERLGDIVDTPQEGGKQQLSQIPIPLIKGEIDCENVSFSFRADAPAVLKNVNVAIPAGMFVGIVGESGSGKSTFAKLVQRLYRLEDGRIYIDKYDIGKVELSSLRSQIGTVPQDALLFNLSVKDNIALTNPEASDADIIRAARIAEAHDFIMALPLGYNTPVGEKGSSLSGGQRQRIAIARTVLQNPSIIILDEATSALDPVTEGRLCANMIEAFADKTVLFITHRLQSIMGAGKILCFHDGSIDETGTHGELMDIKGRYYALFQKQELSVIEKERSNA